MCIWRGREGQSSKGDIQFGWIRSEGIGRSSEFVGVWRSSEEREEE